MYSIVLHASVLALQVPCGSELMYSRQKPAKVMRNEATPVWSEAIGWLGVGREDVLERRVCRMGDIRFSVNSRIMCGPQGIWVASRLREWRPGGTKVTGGFGKRWEI